MFVWLLLLAAVVHIVVTAHDRRLFCFSYFPHTGYFCDRCQVSARECHPLVGCTTVPRVCAPGFRCVVQQGCVRHDNATSALFGSASCFFAVPASFSICALFISFCVSLLRSHQRRCRLHVRRQTTQHAQCGRSGQSAAESCQGSAGSGRGFSDGQRCWCWIGVRCCDCKDIV